jgi:hypothetical protein
VPFGMQPLLSDTDPNWLSSGWMGGLARGNSGSLSVHSGSFDSSSLEHLHVSLEGMEVQTKQHEMCHVSLEMLTRYHSF